MSSLWWSPWDPYGPLAYLLPAGGALILLFGAGTMLLGCLKLLLSRQIAGGLVIGVGTVGINAVAVSVPFVWPMVDGIVWQLYSPMPGGWWLNFYYPYVPMEYGLLWAGMGFGQVMSALGLMLIRGTPRDLGD